MKNAILELHKDGFIAYCGAGISISPPTCAPSWWTLAEEILYNFFESIPEEWEVPKDLIVKDPNFQPEVLFENWASILDMNLYRVFKALDVTSPNGNHKMLARLAKAGILKAVFTTNFDIYIERALREEGVEFELVVDNTEYDNLFNRLKSGGLGDKVLVCKIHGTIERPDTIIAVASAYKSAKGFSTPKARVYMWLLERFPCLFLGYSGWDFEHVNYRLFWERAGPKLRGIYWNRRPGETGGPDFNDIFSSFRDKFKFCEADLPDGWISAIQQNQVQNVALDNLKIQEGTDIDKYWDDTKAARDKFFDEWAISLPEHERLTTVIVEGFRHSEKYKDTMQKGQEATADMGDWDAAEDEILEQEENLNALKQSGQISEEEYTKRMADLAIERSLVFVAESMKEPIRNVIKENRYPGITDNKAKVDQFVSKITTLGYRFNFKRSLKIALELTKEEEEAQKIDPMTQAGMKERTAITFLTQFKLTHMREADEDWKPYYEQYKEAVDKYVKGELDQTVIMQLNMELAKKMHTDSMGMTVPVMDLLQREVDLVANAQTAEDFTEGCISIYWAIMHGMSLILKDYYETKEWALINAAVNPELGSAFSLDPKEMQKYAAEMQKITQDLMQKMIAGEITSEEYSQQMDEFMFGSQPAATEPEVQREDGHAIVPTEVLDNFYNLMKDIIKPVLDTQKKFFGEEITLSYMLLEMGLVLLMASSTGKLGYSEDNYEVKARQEVGQYHLTTGNPSIYRYLKGKFDNWLDKALNEIPERFIQRICYTLIIIAEIGNDIELCKIATERSLKSSGGKIIENTPLEVTSTLATLYEDIGDKENALKYYLIALEGVRLAIPPHWTNAIIYRTAFLLNEKGEKEKALKIIGELHEEFRGPKPPYEIPTVAKKLVVDLANQMASELGYQNAHEAVDALLKE